MRRSRSSWNALPPDVRRGVEPPQLFAVGEVLADTYEIRALLGEGGMGQVYEAFDRGLGRRVAIKAAWRDGAASSIRAEARALAALRHLGLVAVHALARHDGIEFVVMERLHGVTLEAHLARRRRGDARFSIADALDVLVPLADALAAVHRAGVAHRDVKPGNVMLAPAGRVVLVDFGIFLPEIDPSLREECSGSPDYMAPETIAAATARGDAFLVDVYAFGVVAFELLAGELPFPSDSVARVLHDHVATPAPRVSSRRPEVPARLCRLVASLLEKSPMDRPQSMETVAFELRAIRDALPRKDDTKLRVVVAEDDPAMASVLREIVRLVAPDADVRVASDGEMALELVRASRPKLVLLDLNMPKMNGLEVTMHLCGGRLGARSRIVVVSAGAQEQDADVLASLGVSDVVRKGPDLVERLLSALRRALDAHPANAVA